ncbi:MAG: hypothetical protein IPL93_08335 [Actinomycetales bacterium]|nr:hypothetical protein [Actinomycetales bacterium]
MSTPRTTTSPAAVVLVRTGRELLAEVTYADELGADAGRIVVRRRPNGRWRCSSCGPGTVCGHVLAVDLTERARAALEDAPTPSEVAGTGLDPVARTSPERAVTCDDDRPAPPDPGARAIRVRSEALAGPVAGPPVEVAR